jgi:SAM-dependent methyltransferase
MDACHGARRSLAELRDLEQLERLYRLHHHEGEREDFVFCSPERSPLFAEWVGGPGLRVLDLGCRDGALTRAYLNGNAVTGVDADRAALARAARLGIDTIWADLDQALPLEDASFDVVVLGEVLEHLRHPERTFAEARRVLAPGGTLVGSVPNSHRLKARLRVLIGRSQAEDPTLRHMFAPADVRRLLDGLHDLEIRCVAGRLTHLQPRLFENVIVFRGRNPVGEA